MRLWIEILPVSTWNNNIRNLMGKIEWDKLRKNIYKTYNHRCGVCLSKSKLHCHEIWEFDEKKHTQTLTGFIALCELCHAIKHIGFAKIQADRGEFTWDKLINHYCKVNQCKKSDFDKNYKKALQIFEKRSKYDWEVKIGELNLADV